MTMTNKEAIKVLQVIRNTPSVAIFNRLPDDDNTVNFDYIPALELAIKALEILDDVNHRIYRNEQCDRAGKCIDYIGYHCAGCNGAKEAGNETNL